MNNTQQKRSLGLLLAFLGTFLFALKSIFIKLAYFEGLNSDVVLMLRMAIALPIYLGILSYIFCKKDKSKALTQTTFFSIIGLGFIGYFLASLLDLKGLETISAGLERLTLFTYPIFTAILGAIFFSTPLTKRIVIVLITTYLGLWTMFNQESLLNDSNDIGTGVILVLFSALSYAFYVLSSKKIISSIGSVLFTAIAMSASSAFVLFFYFLLFDFSQVSISHNAWLWMFLLAIVSTVIPSFLISEAIHRISPLQTSIVGMLGPIVTIILAVFILSEPFGVYQILGISLVMLGVGLLTFRRQIKK
ncbi:DMT family transporter [bacterium endosymbiont of Bathymodiolus sp. 5 South]|jgi:drug/metabolite transporter (DMT)-like permease|uniref:DMT family transporter n=1 Tax=bacterium endosymbiont of Bathymodiolus sp. 5 South TaxID=1181670 RepID=UPI0010B2E137|nr:DMT family transporter [bacterium endosymbiont of Bathymodiolus sp. 5 South]SHN89419.1 Permease of the drug/metabolite transporter (DMT) superfamily [bacterium endosymbiont of Bathymodiolus sp. 5 South]SSC07042.1 Permease of the drug/metabolite transporter (DMT) superfamily [bacterium endosymbiont of Bathymodiolus sp. 5 South]VVH56601.1 Permease of the drug/metabolite transporter (DMT) superfamily [uncultured Gammaproteobacteria bacterium]VVH61291.1 Permease of the drug/metabolite transporte